MSRWCARLALLFLAGVAILGLAAIPANEVSRPYTRVWPLPREWAGHHVIANLEMVCAWAAVGIAALVVVVLLVGHLRLLAGWSGSGTRHDPLGHPYKPPPPPPPSRRV